MAHPIFGPSATLVWAEAKQEPTAELWAAGEQWHSASDAVRHALDNCPDGKEPWIKVEGGKIFGPTDVLAAWTLLTAPDRAAA